ncbi:hypothetical protein FHR71_003675 [Methylobacterium sp. RAS18]|nr:hypothetical protein [Methylobacterium sp. RAS18]
MTHALTISTGTDRAPFHADPILAAIERHSEAWSIFQVAPEGDASIAADAETFDALNDLLATPCATRAGMFCLIRHLRWFLETEATNADAYEIVGGPNAWTIARAREADLSRCLGVERIERLPIALPSGRLLGPVIDLRPVPVLDGLPPRAPAFARVNRAVSLGGDVLAAVVIVIGGCGLSGLATLL